MTVLPPQIEYWIVPLSVWNLKPQPHMGVLTLSGRTLSDKTYVDRGALGQDFLSQKRILLLKTCSRGVRYIILSYPIISLLATYLHPRLTQKHLALPK